MSLEVLKIRKHKESGPERKTAMSEERRSQRRPCRKKTFPRRPSEQQQIRREKLARLQAIEPVSAEKWDVNAWSGDIKEQFEAGGQTGIHGRRIMAKRQMGSFFIDIRTNRTGSSAMSVRTPWAPKNMKFF